MRKGAKRGGQDKVDKVVALDGIEDDAAWRMGLDELDQKSALEQSQVCVTSSNPSDSRRDRTMVGSSW